jgi:hypothetical protein
MNLPGRPHGRPGALLGMSSRERKASSMAGSCAALSPYSTSPHSSNQSTPLENLDTKRFRTPEKSSPRLRGASPHPPATARRGAACAALGSELVPGPSRADATVDSELVEQCGRGLFRGAIAAHKAASARVGKTSYRIEACMAPCRLCKSLQSSFFDRLGTILAAPLRLRNWVQIRSPYCHYIGMPAATRRVGVQPF